MRKWLLTMAAVVLGSASSIRAQEFFDTSAASKFFTFGARVGLNTSTRTFPSGNFTNKLLTTWGTGFDAGVVANLNFREYLSVQPGFFFESRSSNMANYVQYYKDNNDPQVIDYYNVEHQRSYYFTIPVMAIVKFNLSDQIKWNVEAGPYVQFMLKETGNQNKMPLYELIPHPNDLPTQLVYEAEHKSVDFGFKLGTGLQVYDHYYVGVHYLAGVCKAWNVPSGGKNKAWMFTLGYDF